MLTRRKLFAVSLGAALYPTLCLPMDAQQRGEEVLTRANLAAYEQGVLTAATFEKLVGTRFWVDLPNGERRTMVLQAVTHSTHQLLAARQTEDLVARTQRVYSQTRRLSSFSVSFQVEGAALPQENYVLDSPALGRFAALLVPGQGTTCHTTFSSLGPED